MVPLTSAPEGRTYMIKSWVLDPDIESGNKPSRHNHLYYDGDEYIVDETPYVVPNGKWVMERPSYGWSWLVGTTWDKLEDVEIDTRHGLNRTLYISDGPFAYVATDFEDVDMTTSPASVKSTGRKTLHYAQQIHKGELGRGVPIPRLDYVRQPLEPHQKPNVTKARERRRGQHGWVKLADLGEMSHGVGYSPDRQVDLVLGYWQYSGHVSWRLGQRVGTLVDAIWGSALDIQLGNIDVKSLTKEQFREECSDTSEVWIRRGFAYTILRLQALGVRPEVTQTA